MIENLPAASRRAARRQGSSRSASCRSPTSCRAAASPRAIARSSATTCWTTSRGRASARSRSPRGGYLIRTTLDPNVQAPVKRRSTRSPARPSTGVASVMSVIKPGKDVASGAGDGQQPHVRARTATPARPCSRSRSRLSATARARSSRSSPPRRRWTWAWASTLNWTCRAQFQAKGLGSSDTPGCPEGNLVREERRATTAAR